MTTTTAPAPSVPAKPARDKHLADLPRPTRWAVGTFWRSWPMDWQRRIALLEDDLNRQATRGWQLVRGGVWRWGFAPCAPREFIYRVAWLDERYDAPASQAYLRLLTEMGADVVDVFQGGTLVIVRREAALGRFEIADTATSRLAPVRARQGLAFGMVQCGYWFVMIAAVAGWVLWPSHGITAMPAWEYALFVLAGALFGLGIMFVLMGNLNARRSSRDLTRLIADAAVSP